MLNSATLAQKQLCQKQKKKKEKEKGDYILLKFYVEKYSEAWHQQK